MNETFVLEQLRRRCPMLLPCRFLDQVKATSVMRVLWSLLVHLMTRGLIEDVGPETYHVFASLHPFEKTIQQ